MLSLCRTDHNSQEEAKTWVLYVVHPGFRRGTYGKQFQQLVSGIMEMEWNAINALGPHPGQKQKKGPDDPRAVMANL